MKRASCKKTKKRPRAAAEIYWQTMRNTKPPTAWALMPEIPGVTALHGDGEPGLDLVRGTHTHNLPSLLSTEAYHIAKLEKPWQNMAYRLHAPWDWSSSLSWVLISALWPSVPSPSSSSLSLFAGPICLMGDQIAAFKKKQTAHLPKRTVVM